LASCDDCATYLLRPKTRASCTSSTRTVRGSASATTTPSARSSANYGRYATIIGDTTTGEFQTRYPRLVSFVGQTGAGKSTLVKMLIDQQVRRVDPTWELRWPSPVVASPAHDHTPTSADVHLYADPSTCYGKSPMLYADCEGLEGGERLPVSAQHCSAMGGSRHRTEASPIMRHSSVAKVARGSQRIIIWANSPQTRKRQYAVSELYPRLLYTFSDAVVFVLRNTRFALCLPYSPQSLAHALFFHVTDS
jgi:energy-coupling factor transporter ATP-binding protein EcfA2